MTTVLQWRPTNAPAASSRTDDIWFINPATGWAVNNNGQILKTTDGGETWHEQHRSNFYLRCVGFANELRGWVGTLNLSERLYETHDGGNTWTTVQNLPAVSPSAICGLSVVNESVIYASGTNYPHRPARMMKSVDGGASWTGWEMDEFADLLVDTFFTTPERGWVVG
ncbi:MAG TPA: YCF48-related protein, partial [Pyrinomonadaceae bacterium]|nr:YCF48-related protein [Pyrinomonadaceae bacterium]